MLPPSPSFQSFFVRLGPGYGQSEVNLTSEKTALRTVPDEASDMLPLRVVCRCRAGRGPENVIAHCGSKAAAPEGSEWLLYTEYRALVTPMKVIEKLRCHVVATYHISGTLGSM